MKPTFIKQILFWTGLCLLILILTVTWQLQANKINDLRIMEGETHYVNFKLPFVYVRGDRNDIILFNGEQLPLKLSRIAPPYNLEALQLGEVNVEFSLFGRIPLRHITVNVLPEIALIPGGHSIGIKLHSKGVAVVGYYYFEAVGRTVSPARDAGIRIGDTILAINGGDASDVNTAARLLENAGAENIILLISREGREMEINLNPVYSPADSGYRIGLYIRDSAAGVGTLSFYNPATGRYGALGHIILDTDTNKPINLDEGTIVKAKIIDIKTAQRGQPGEKTGIFIEHNGFSGNIEKNSLYGIFGKLVDFESDDSPYPLPIPMALATQVETGYAEILTVLEGESIQRFTVEIEKVSYQTRPSDKGIVLRVTDEALLRQTGGIVQGMSGSPIIQNGRLVGAITHVFVNDPTRGYGIFMEWMHQEAETLTNN
ncbi:MAG: SpoIVB peptidase [Bacillota bacterium]